MSQQLTTISLEAIQYMCGLIRDLASVSEGIDDLHLLSNGTFSSVKIDTLLNTLRSDCNEYTDRLVANLSRLELKIANDESEISQPNIMYLYKASGETSYSQYVVIEGTKVLLGNCDIDMGDYYTITQADAKFVLKTDFDSLKTEVDKKLNKTDVDNITIINAEGVNIKDFILENCTNNNKSYYIIARHSCTDIPTVNTNYFMTVENAGYYTIKVTAKELAGKNNEYMCTYRSDDVKWTNWEKVLVSPDIVTTIDSSSADDKIPSAKAVYDAIHEHILMELSSSSDITALLTKLRSLTPGTNATIRLFDDSGVLFPVAGNYIGTVSVINGNEIIVICVNHWYSQHAYTFRVQGDDTSISVNKICTTKVADVPRTAIVPTDTTKFPSWTNAYYSVSNGICYVSLWGVGTTESGSHIKTGVILPKPLLIGVGTLLKGTGTGAPSGFVYVETKDCVLTLDSPTPNTMVYCSFSYPVSE